MHSPDFRCKRTNVTREIVRLYAAVEVLTRAEILFLEQMRIAKLELTIAKERDSSPWPAGPSPPRAPWRPAASRSETSSSAPTRCRGFLKREPQGFGLVFGFPDGVEGVGHASGRPRAGPFLMVRISGA
jgi:hypothetical protein